MSHPVGRPRAAAVVVTAVLAALLAGMMLSRGGGPEAFAQGGYGQSFVSLSLDPAVAVRSTGTTHTVTARLALGSNPLTAIALVYRIEGAHPAAAATVTDGQGRATISWDGPTDGNDVLTVFSDFDRNGTRSPNEAQAVAAVAFQPGAQAASIRFPRANRSITLDRRGRFAFTILGSRGTHGRASFTTSRAVLSQSGRPRRLTLGSRRFTIPRNGRAVVRIKLSRRALGVLRRRRKLSVRASVKVVGAGTAGYTFRLKAPRSLR